MIPDYYIELRDVAGTLQERIESQTESVKFTYDRVGGCGRHEIRTEREFADVSGVTADWDVRIYLQNNISRDYDLWYRGYVEDIDSQIATPERLIIKGRGYSGQLDRVLITASFANTEVASIVADVMENLGVVSKTSITFDGPNDVTVTSVTAVSLAFDSTPAGQVINKLAEMAGTREWGVDRNAAFFFHERTNVDSLADADKATYTQEAGLDRFTQSDRFREIINAVTIEGGQTGGSTVISESVNSASQVKFGRRERRVSDGSLLNATDTAKLGASIVAELAEPRQEIQFRASLERFSTLVESRVSAGTGATTQLIRFLLPADTYGTKRYGEGRYSGDRFYHLVKADYIIGRSGNFVTINAGEAGHTAGGYSAKISAELDAVRQRTI